MSIHEILVFTALAAVVRSTCYFPDGGISGLDVACNAAASDSACCYSNQACLSNGLCQTGEVDGVLQYARGTCTDPTWQSGACPNFCLDQQSLGNAMFSCNVTGSDRYCCNEGCSCVEDGRNQIISFTGEPYTLTIIGQTGTYPNPSATPTTSSSTTSSSSISASAITTSSSSKVSSTSSSSSSAALSSSSSSSNAVPIGVGVGVGVGAALILGLGAFLFFRRRSRARQQSHMSDKHDSLPGYTDSSAHPPNPRKSSGNNAAYRPYQAGGAGQVNELPTDTMHGRYELGGAQEVARELPGNTTR